MTNENLTLIAVLADHSGSMIDCRQDMEGGLNAFIEEQRNEPGLLDLALAEFDHRFNIVRPMGRLSFPYRYALIPSGNTALLDAMGRYITEIGGQLDSLAESNRPAKVIMLIVTDGLENASREWTREQVKALVEQQRTDYGWEFVFLGANIDAVAEGVNLGMARGSSMIFDASDSAAVANSYVAAGVYTSSVRGPRVAGAAAPEFTDEDREKAMGKKTTSSSTP